MPIVDLQVPYAKKDIAKALGARWDMDRKTWYAPAGSQLEPFAEWMSAAVWLAQNDRPKAKCKAGKKKARAPKERIDASGGRITIGANYVEAVGAVGLPWKVI